MAQWPILDDRWIEILDFPSLEHLLGRPARRISRIPPGLVQLTDAPVNGDEADPMLLPYGGTDNRAIDLDNVGHPRHEHRSPTSANFIAH